MFSVFYGIVPRGINRGHLGKERKGEIPQLNKLGNYWVKRSNTNTNSQEKGTVSSTAMKLP